LKKYLESYKDAPHWFNTLLISWAIFGLNFGITRVSYNLYLKSLGFNEKLAGYAAAAASIGSMLVAYKIGKWMDKNGVGKMISIGLPLLGIFVIAKGFSTTQTTIIASSFFAGMIFRPLLHAFEPLLAIGKEKYANYRYTLGFVVGGIFQTAGSYLGGVIPLLINEKGNKESFQIMYLILGIINILSYSILKKLKNVHHSKKKEKSNTKFKELLQVNNGLIAKYWIYHAPLALGAGMSIPFMNLYLSNQIGLTNDQIGNAFSIQEFMLVVGYLIAPVLAKKTQSTITIAILNFLSIPFLVILAFTTNPTIAIFSFVARATLINATHPLGSRLLMEITPQEHRSKSLAVVGIIWALGWTIGPPISGVWIDTNESYKEPFLFTSFLYLVSTITYYVFFRKIKFSEEKATQ
tara:strand:+ start:1978 stop:3201 length:1224 start_codon:yes stop_codon:yes gene_type:complete